MDIIAIYAAIISTITLVWTIINAIIEKLPRIKINIDIKATLELASGVEAGPISYVIDIKVIYIFLYQRYY